MTSIPPDFFDEERDKVFQMEIIQDSLVERIDKLIKKSSEVDARLDIIEEEMEEQTKISINGKTWSKSDQSQLRPVQTQTWLNTDQTQIRPDQIQIRPNQTWLNSDQSHTFNWTHFQV